MTVPQGGPSPAFDPHQLPYGEDSDGQLVPVADVPSGLACGLICPHCRARLVAEKGPIKRHCFRHEADAVCAGAGETILHRMAKRLIAEAGGVYVPDLLVTVDAFYGLVVAERWARFDRVELEVWQDGFRPDLIAYRGKGKLAIEVRVSHPCGAEKIALLATRGMACIEIDLRGFRDLFDEAGLARALQRAAPREWVSHPQLEAARRGLRGLRDATYALEQEAEARRAEEARRKAALVAAQREAERQKWLEEDERRREEYRRAEAAREAEREARKAEREALEREQAALVEAERQRAEDGRRWVARYKASLNRMKLRRFIAEITDAAITGLGPRDGQAWLLAWHGYLAPVHMLDAEVWRQDRAEGYWAALKEAIDLAGLDDLLRASGGRS